jgi:hypothetical protein
VERYCRILTFIRIESDNRGMLEWSTDRQPSNPPSKLGPTFLLKQIQDNFTLLKIEENKSDYIPCRDRPGPNSMGNTGRE